MSVTASRWALLASPNYRRYFLERVCSVLAFQIIGVSVGWLVYDQTSSAYALGFVGLAQFLPLLVLMLVVGVVVDRYDRRVVVATSQAGAAMAIGVFAIGFHFGAIGTIGIFVLVMAIGTARAFEHPGNSALLPSIVSEEEYPRALALSTTAFQSAAICGPALGGLLYAIAPLVPFAVATLAYGLAAVLVAGMRHNRPAPAREKVTLETVFSGVRFIMNRPTVLGSISLDMFAVLLGGATALLPIYAKDIFHTTPFWLGVLRAAPSIGALAMSAVLARSPITTGVGWKMFAAVAVFGLATIGFAFSTSVEVALVFLVLIGASDVVSVLIRSGLVQMSTPDAMRGRVSSVNALFIGTSNQLGEFESGVTAGWFGPVAAAALGGIGTLAIVALWIGLFPTLARVDRFPHQTSQ